MICKRCLLTIATWIGLISVVFGRLEIINSFHPFYVKAGSTLSISCESKDETIVEWRENTASSNWQDATIDPLPGSKFIVQTFGEKPSGLTRSTLLKQNVSSSDRGIYICKDQRSSYEIFVTVLSIDVKKVSTSLSLEDQTVRLSCSVSGFDSNPPSIDYDWTYNGLFIPHPHHFMERAAIHPASHFKPIDKYSVTFYNGELSLDIKRATVSDAGAYNCSFTFKTTGGRVTLTESVFLNATQLNLKTAGGSTYAHMSVLTFIVIIFVPLIVEF